MMTPRSVLIFSVAGCLSFTLCTTAVVSTAAAADTSATLSLLQQPSLDAPRFLKRAETWMIIRIREQGGRKNE